MRLSPEINPRGEPSLLSGAGALSGRSTLGPKGPVRSRRGRRTGRMIMRVPRELGRPRRLHRQRPAGARLTNSGMIRGPAPGAVGDEHEGAAVVPPSEGNEVRRDGRRGVGARRITCESGEPHLRDPAEGRACRVMDPWEGSTWRTQSLTTRVNLMPADRSEGRRTHDVTSRMP